MLICKIKGKKGWWQVSNIHIGTNQVTYVDVYHDDLSFYVQTTTDLKYIKKIKYIKNDKPWIKKKAKSLEKDKIKALRTRGIRI